MSQTPDAPLRTTFTGGFDERYAARRIDFHGWWLPLSYDGILEEHRWTREQCGLFNVSHMGRFLVRGPDTIPFLDSLLPNDVAALRPGRALYSPLCDDAGGIIDDLVVYKSSAEECLVIVNAANRDGDWAWLIEHSDGRSVALLDRSELLAQIAVQGPAAEAVVQPHLDVALASVPYFHHCRGRIAGVEALIAATGYTGEDGFELYLPSARALAVWELLAADPRVRPCGLGARDLLRLEAGFRLYGQDMDREHTPIEAGLSWTVKFGKGSFLGREAMRRPCREQLMGLTVEGRQPPRTGYPIVERATGRPIGRVTSGAFSPWLGHGVALGYVTTPAPEGELAIDARGRLLPARRATLPFVDRVTRRARRGDRPAAPGASRDAGS